MSNQNKQVWVARVGAGSAVGAGVVLFNDG